MDKDIVIEKERKEEKHKKEPESEQPDVPGEKGPIRGKWEEIKNAVKEKWAELTDEDMEGSETSAAGLQTMLEKRYGYEKEAARRQIETFLKENGLNENDLL